MKRFLARKKSMELFPEGNVAEDGENFVEYILMLLAAMLSA